MSTSQGEVNGQDSLTNGISMGTGETEGTKNDPTGIVEVYTLNCTIGCKYLNLVVNILILQGTGSRGVPWRHMALGGRVGSAARRADGKNLAKITHYWDLLTVVI